MTKRIGQQAVGLYCSRQRGLHRRIVEWSIPIYGFAPGTESWLLRWILRHQQLMSGNIGWLELTTQ